MSVEKVNEKFVDLSEFDDLVAAQETGIDVPIRRPTGDPLGLTIRVAGPDSKRQKQAFLNLRDEQLKSDDPAPLDAAGIDQRNIRGLAKATISWTPFKLGGKVYSEYSEEAAVELYTRHPFIREQVDAKAASRSGFMKSSSIGSSKPSGDGSTA